MNSLEAFRWAKENPGRYLLMDGSNLKATCVNGLFCWCRSLGGWKVQLSECHDRTWSPVLMLREIAPGSVFRVSQNGGAAKGVLAVKTEYWYSNDPGGQSMCILLSSGEYAYFEKRNETEVEIVKVLAE